MVAFPMPAVERLTEAVGKAGEYYERFGRHEGFHAGPAGFTIAISREAGTPDAAVAKAVGARLDWPVYDHELIERIAHDLHVRTRLIDAIDEKEMNWLVETAEAFAITPAPTVNESAFVHRLHETLLALAALGKCVIVGRGAPHVLPAPTTLRVRLVAPRHDRALFISRQRNISLPDAEHLIDATDQQRVRFVAEHFQKNATDATLYDLVVNVSRFSADECADVIVTALQCLEARTPGQARTATPAVL